VRAAPVVLALLCLNVFGQSSDGCTTVNCYQERLAHTSLPGEQARFHGQLGWLFVGKGELESALAEFRSVLAISRETGNRAMEGNSINFIGLVQQFLGDHAAALDSYQHAHEIARQTNDRRLEGVVLFHLGWLHFLRHELADSVRSYEASLAARRETGDRRGEALTLMNLGMTYSDLGQFEKALQYEREALPLIQSYGERGQEADVLDHTGVALMGLHRPEEAIGWHTRALEIRKAAGGRWSEPFSLSSRARALRAAGRLEEAARDMREVVDIMELGRRNLSTRRFRASAFAGATRHYEHYVDLLMALRDDLTALSISERARARLTLDAVRDSLARAGGPAGDSVLMREDALRDEIERRQRELDTAPPESAPALSGGIDALRKDLRGVEEEIRLRYPVLAEARNADARSVEQIRDDLLDDRTAVVEYFLGQEKSYVWILTRDAIVSKELPPRAAVERAAVRLHTLLAAGDQRAKRRELDQALASLAAMIVPRVPRPIDRLIIVPDGALFYVPFSALGLINRYEIVMAPSASALVLLRHGESARARAATTVAVFADPVFRADDPRVARGAHSRIRPDPDLLRSASESGLRDLHRLPATRIEANAIGSLARGEVRKALDFDASRDAFLREELNHYRVVHFATHALVNAQHPELSGIVLSLVDRRGKPVDGFLRVPDLYRLNGASDLVVLSACHTAAGRELRGEGIVGLVSGFMNGGTPRIVASYWDVKDQPTAELMKRFYRALFTSGASPAAALRTAQRSMRNEERWRSPVYWAAFALYGLP
jgi:CHAT domain-containing protein